MSAGPLFWTKYTDAENQYGNHQAAVIQIDLALGKALILAPGNARKVKVIDLDQIEWARWD